MNDLNFAFTFDARNVPPSQGGSGGHPVGNHVFTITDSQVKTTSDGSGGMLVLTLTSNNGSIEKRYNLWNKSAQAVEIAQKELSAMCYAVGIFIINTPNAMELRSGRGMMEIDFQSPSAKLIEDNKQRVKDGLEPKLPFVEVKKVYDVNGNEPGKTPVQPAANAAPNFQQGAAPAPNTGANASPNAQGAQPNASSPSNPQWAAQTGQLTAAPQANPAPTTGQTQWANPATQQAPVAPAQGWQQGQAAGGSPPWGAK
jgi:hypothetical protein